MVTDNLYPLSVHFSIVDIIGGVDRAVIQHENLLLEFGILFFNIFKLAIVGVNLLLLRRIGQV